MFMYPIPGLTLQIRNLTNTTIKNVYYTHNGGVQSKIRKISAKEKKEVLILTNSFKHDKDLILFIDTDSETKFIFKDILKANKNNMETLYNYFFVKIIEVNDTLVIEEDPEGRDLYYKYT